MHLDVQGDRLVITRPGGRVETRVRSGPHVEMYVHDTRVDVQPRPFCVGDEDPSGGECALALFILCCLDRGLSPVRLLRTATSGPLQGERVTQEWKQNVGRIAAFEGVCIPDAWTPKTVDALLYSLFEAGYASIVEYVDREVGRVVEIGDRTRLHVARAHAYQRLLLGNA